jgi:hypothetical protein
MGSAFRMLSQSTTEMHTFLGFGFFFGVERGVVVVVDGDGDGVGCWGTPAVYHGEKGAG